MKWPEEPTCHGVKTYWIVPREDGPLAYRRCSACGSTHPGDLTRLFGTAEPLFWRNIHLLDRGYDEASISLLVHVLFERRTLLLNRLPPRKT